ncbi:MAG: hypothetical protein HN368_03105 [Spirochaetales bacterium]|nr:hypothetical protein [Spirochaetales bacterium]
MTSENLREKCELLERENAELKADKATAPDFGDPGSVVRWHGENILRYLAMMKKEKASSRLRLLNSSIDSWSRASRLAHDSSEIETLKNELSELRDMIMTGPQAVVK